MEQKKYKFTNEAINFKHVILHRIQALKDFSFIKAGDLGGWIEKEENLSQFGEELIKKAYKDNKKSGREYERIVRYVESILADEKRDK